MSIWHSLKWANRHGTACALLILLLLGCFGLHRIAFGTITIFSGIPNLSWPPRALRTMAGVQFFQDNFWFALPYVLLFLGTLIYMEIREFPRWAVWTTFLFMSLPILGYLYACIRLGFYTPAGTFFSS